MEDEESFASESTLDDSSSSTLRLVKGGGGSASRRRTRLDHVVTALKPDAPKYKGDRSTLSVVRAQELMLISSLAEREVEVKDRRWLMKKYDSCFVGAELVDWMVANLEEVQGDRELAVRLGRELLHYGYIAHVVLEHDFKDENLFYVFSLDVSRTLEAKTLAIVEKPFSDLSLHADLPRLRLQIGGDPHLDDESAPARVGKFLEGMCLVAGAPPDLGPKLKSFCESVSNPDMLPEALLIRMMALEKSVADNPENGFLLRLLGCCTQSSIAAFFVFLKQQSRVVGGINSVAGLWTVSVAALGDMVIVSQSRADTSAGGTLSSGTPRAPFTFHWSVLFIFSKLDGQLKRVTPTLTKFEGRSEEETVITQLFEKMRLTTV